MSEPQEYFQLIGGKIAIKTHNCGTIEGELFYSDFGPDFTIIRQQRDEKHADYHIIADSEIDSILSHEFPDATAVESMKLEFPSTQLLERRLNLSRTEFAMNKSKIGIKVAESAQHIFDKLYKCFKGVKWHGEEIHVMEGEAWITPPYNEAAVAGTNESSVERLRIVMGQMRDDKNGFQEGGRQLS